MQCTITLIHYNCIMLNIENLTFSYGKNREVLKDFSLQFGSGEICGLLGPNGAGKSTLLYLICGLLTPSKGSVKFRGIETRKRKVTTLEEIFIVPEEFELPPISVNEYVRINSILYPNFSSEKIRKNLDMFEIDSEANMGSMSMGQRKKAFISFAFACNTPLLLMDEPTNGLDIPGKSQFRRLIISDTTDDRTVIISTHQVRDIDKILDHIVLMNDRSTLLNESIETITDRLKFITSDSPILPERTLFSQPGISGQNIICENIDGETTQINLETLFEFALKQPEIIKTIFQSKKDSSDDEQ